MRVLLDIQDSKASFFLEVLKNFSFVKAKPLSDEKARLFEDLKEAANEVRLHKQGKINLKTAEELLNEL
jgi:hypothetical protein